MTTFAPAARHACACAFCFCGSLRALLIDAVTPAFLKAALAMSGASNCTQRTDDFVSGSRTQTWTLAVFFFVLAVARRDDHGEARDARRRAARTDRPAENLLHVLSFSVAADGASASESAAKRRANSCDARQVKIAIVNWTLQPRTVRLAPMKTCLGIWAFGAMATRFDPGGYKPELAGESTVEQGADAPSRGSAT